jgi:PIN domain nuclease of toxin-antitoxin system
MIAGVADTHAAVWYLFGDPRLSATAKSFIDQAATDHQTIGISPISLAEVIYLIEKKNRLPASAFDDLRSCLDSPKHVFKEAFFTRDVVKVMQQVSREAVPDMPDRIVAATALYFGVPVVSRDGKIRVSSVQTIW